MEILIVDDVVAIVNGIEKGIQWEVIGISKVWKAYNAIDAKIILQNEKIDILLCDIEMPEENGLSLCRWIKKNGYGTECVLLTAYADFEYAKEAVKLGVFDYILQPARYEEIQHVLQNVIKRINIRRSKSKFSDLGKQFYVKKQIILDDILRNWIRGRNNDSEEVIRELRGFGYSVAGEQEACCALIQILRWNDENKRLNNELLCFVTGNIIRELLAEFPVSVICFYLNTNLLSCIIAGDRDSMPRIRDIQQQLSRYIEEMFKIYSCEVTVFFDDPVTFKDVPESIKHIGEIGIANEQSESKVYCALDEEWNKNSNMDISELSNDEQDIYVEKAVQYIRSHIEQSLKRTDIAQFIGLNEDYLSRLFKSKKGISLKEYVVNEKMKVAKNLLLKTNLPIGAIAAKVGYYNFSHFSAAYRKIYGITPMTERDLREDS